jgi:tRNA-specific 2-thiouridylase
VRAHARRLGLITADKPESQEICFVPDDDYRKFLRGRHPDMWTEGPIVDGEGQSLGRHDGLAGFTIGQRKGLGLNAGRALYVVDLDPARNAVTVGPAVQLERSRLEARDTNFIAGPPPATPLRVTARIRHNHAPAAATVRALPGNRAEVLFDRPQRAVTPGQSVVWYQDDLVVGGGVITRTPAS